MKVTSPKKHFLGFDQIGWNETHRKIKSIQSEVDRLARLLKEAGIHGLDVSQLLRNPFKIILPHAPESFQILADGLSNPELLNWDRFPVHKDIIAWARQNSVNVDLVNYHNFYKVANGEAKVDEAKLDELKEQLSRYTEGEKQSVIFSMVNQAVEVLNSAQNLVGPWVDIYSGEADLHKPFKREGNRYTVNEEFIRKF